MVEFINCWGVQSGIGLFMGGTVVLSLFAKSERDALVVSRHMTTPTEHGNKMAAMALGLHRLLKADSANSGHKGRAASSMDRISTRCPVPAEKKMIEKAIHLDLCFDAPSFVATLINY